jgi:hypothetical protein
MIIYKNMHGIHARHGRIFFLRSLKSLPSIFNLKRFLANIRVSMYAFGVVQVIQNAPDWGTDIVVTVFGMPGRTPVIGD